jgi:hypothetical protein
METELDAARKQALRVIRETDEAIQEQVVRVKEVLREKQERLDLFEAKMKADTKIADNDLLYLTQEISRNRDWIA